jgi:Spy/CpxP family protein refolding chaperone
MRKFRTVLALALIFVLGAAAGASYQRGAVQRERAALRADEHNLVDRFLARRQSDYASRLKITDGQIEQLRPVLEKARAELYASRERAAREVWRIMGEHYQALFDLLTPEQQAVFQQVIEERKTGAHKIR